MFIHESNHRPLLVLPIRAGIVALLMVGSVARAQQGQASGAIDAKQEDANATLTEEEFLQKVRAQPGYVPLPAAPTEQERKLMIDVVRGKVTDQATTRVIVGFDMPDYARLRDLSIGQKNPTLSEEADGRLAAAIQEFVDRELAGLPRDSYEALTTYRTVPAVLMKVDARALQALEASQKVQNISLDGELKLMLDDTVRQVQATDIWAQGFEASDWYVAIIDTGILATHEAFAGRDIVQACFSLLNQCPNGQAQDTTSPNAAQHYSGPCWDDHGTHVSGIAASNGQVDGVARGANIIAVRVGTCHNDEWLITDGVLDSAMEHVYSKRNIYNIASVNLSIGRDNPAPISCDADDPSFTTVVANLKSVGIATVAASGNDGECLAVSWPACISNVIAVGATDNFIIGMLYSNTDLLNPDVLDLYAPGDDVYAPVATSNTDYDNKSGTSMASPHVAGGIALMRDVLSTYVEDVTQDPTVDELLNALKVTGSPVIRQGCSIGELEPQTKIRLANAIGMFLNPGRTWVRFGWTGTENGDWAFPYNSLAEAAQNAADNDTLRMHAGSSAEAVTINRPLTLTAVDGVVTIGQ